MTKLQKIWLGVGLGMFIIPEILWSPITNIIYSLFNANNHSLVLRQSFLFDADKVVYLTLVLGVQLIGVIMYLVNIARIQNGFLKYFGCVLSVLALLFNCFALYILFSLRNGISF